MNAAERARLEREDAEARVRVRTEFEGAIVLEAGAGTGKTTTLVARVCAWLVGPGFDGARRELAGETDLERVAARALDGVLSITFTEAAAADMDAKLRAALAQIEAGAMPTGMEGHRFECDRAEAQRRAELLRRALERPLARTIHAYCRALLAEHPLAIGLHPGFEVDVDGRRVREIVREEVVRDLRVDLGRGNASEWHALAAREIGPAGVEDALVELALDGVRARDLDSEAFPPEVVRAIDDELRESVRAFLADCSGAMRAASKRTPTCGKIVTALTEIVDRIAAPAGSGAEIAARARWIDDRFDDSLREKLAQWAEKRFGKFMAVVSDEFELIAARSARLDRSLSRFVRLDPVLEHAARTILGRILARAREVLVRQGVETFGDLLRDAAELLAKSPATAARVRAGLRQVLVDEFQDTDGLQCEIVEALALGPGPRPGLLIVGDPKQSIYGFRRADLRAYDSFTKKLVGNGGRVLRLSVNYRSQQAILDRVAQVMQHAMVAEDEVQPEFKALVASRTDTSAVLEHWHVAPLSSHVGAAEGRIEAQFLAAELRAAKDAGLEWHEMGVLVRTRTPLEVMLEALRAADIPFDVVGDRSYYRRREVQDAAALVACCVDPSDLLALVTFLRSPFVGVPDALWIPLRAASDGLFAIAPELDARAPETIARARAAVRAAIESMPRDVPGIERLRDVAPSIEHALETIAVARASFATEPVDVWLEKLRELVLAEATAAARFQGQYRIANLRRFFREIEHELERDGGDVVTLLRTLRGAIAESRDAAEAKPAGAAGHSAVQIQTMHQSKGLQYRAVFLVGLHRTSQGGSRGRRRTRVEGSARVLFDAPTPDWFDVEEHARKREGAELVRLLYVAMTRAVDRLVVSGTYVRGKDDDGARDPRGAPHMLALFDAALAPAAGFLGGKDGHEAELDGVRYRMARVSGSIELAAGAPFDAAPFLERAHADARRLRDLRPVAAARASRALLEPMTAEVARSRTEEDVRGRVAPGAAGLAGSAVHAVLETVDLSGDVVAALSRVPDAIGPIVAEAARSGSQLDSAEIAAGETRAKELMRAFASGRLGARFAEVAPHVVARELALLAGKEGADGFTSVSSGAIDLLYRDPRTRELVVVDYKTDQVSGADDAHRATERHRPQVDAYRSALQRALALSKAPRAELWFLAADAIVAIE